MAHDPPRRFPLQASDVLTQWLMESDPSIRWQVMRDPVRGLDYFRKTGAAPDQRMAKAVVWVHSKRGIEGRWRLEVKYPDPMLLEIDEVQGQPSRWTTLRALRVPRSYSGGRH